MIHISERHAVARVVATAHESHMMILNKGSLLDSFLPIGVEALVDEHVALGLDGIAVTVSVEHLEVFAHVGETQLAVIGNGGSMGGALLGDNLDDTRCATRAILGNFTGILENSETLDIRRINR